MKYIRRILLTFAAGVVLTLLANPVYSQENNHYREGVNYYLDGKIASSLESLEKAYAETPKNKDIVSLYTEVMILRAGEHFQEKEYEKAFEIIKEARKISPGNSDVNEIYRMLDDRLNPDKEEIKDPDAAGEGFGQIEARQEQKRQERVEIVREPPQQLTVRERELLRPIIIGGQPQEDNRTLYYVLAGVAVFLILVSFAVVYFIKEIVNSNSATMKELSELSSEKTSKLEKELKKLRQTAQKDKDEEKKSRHKESRNVRLDRERIKKEYSELLKESLKSSTRAPGSPSEPKIAEEPAANKDKEIEIKAEFRKLKKVNYGNSIKLLRNMIKNKNIWIQLWAAELAGELKPDDAVNILKDAVSSDEYQVSKRAIKTLKGFLESKKVEDYQKKEIESLIDSVRKEGWVV